MIKKLQAPDEATPSHEKRGVGHEKIFDHRFPHLVKSGEIEKLFAKWNW
jgi:hypothetical protein